MEERLYASIEQLHAAIEDFESALAVNHEDFSPRVADLVQNGQIQKFEFTIELFWKTVRVFLLEFHGLDIPSPKPAIKNYFELGHIDYPGLERLLRALEIRNSLSHLYKKEAFVALHAEILGFRGFFLPAASAMIPLQLLRLTKV